MGYCNRLVRLPSRDYDFGTVSHMTSPAMLQSELFSQLAEPFVGEAVFDCLADVVFFIKNRRGEYVVVNQTLAERCGRREKSELTGRRADQVFPVPFGERYRAQDEEVLQGGTPIVNQMELHFYPAGGRGWCLTNKRPLLDRAGRVVGLAGVSQDLQAPSERGEDYSRVADIVQHIHKHYGDSLKVTELAERSELSAYQLEQRVRRIFQITVGQLIQKVRMDAAVKRLRDGDAAIADIALDCGYSDQSAFTRQFRQTTGLSPSEYRRTFRER